MPTLKWPLVRFIACGLIVAMCPPWPALRTAHAESPSGVVEQLVEQLSSEKYDERERATRELISHGKDAVPPLGGALDGRNLEVTIRGVFVLRELALSGDEATEAAAEAALQIVASNRRNAAANRAEEALAHLGELRQDRSLKNLQKLGAVVDTNYEEVGLTFGGIYAIEIGEQWRGTVKDLRQLRWLVDIEQVIFDGPQVTDEWFDYLVGMERLAILKVRRGKITNDALASLPKLPRLLYVKLLYVDVDDDSATHFEKCPQLAKVLLYGTDFTALTAERLRTRGMDVDVRRGAFLGISVPRNNEGENWVINEVTPGSAAAEAGLRAYDVITKFGEQEVGDFASLMAMIAEHDAGDRVTVEFLRQGTRKTREITFGEWK